MALFGGCLLLFTGLAGAINRVVDPFWYYRDLEIPGLNASRTKFQRFERYVKPVLVARDRPQALIFGSSFAEIGFDPLNPAFTRNGELAGYNFAIAGAPWTSVQCYFLYALRVAPVRRVVIGLTPGPLPAADCERELPDLGRAPDFALLFSVSALKASLETVAEQGRERPSHTAAGLYYYVRGEPGVDHRFREYLQRRLRADPKCARDIADGKTTPGTGGETASLEPTGGVDLEGLRRIVRTAVEKRVELRVVAYPQHAYSQELDFLCGTARAKWEALRQIAGLIEREGGAGVQLWEFYGYNPVMAEPVDSVRTRYWQDADHFNYEIGNSMLAEMFGAPPRGESDTAAPGRRLTPSNVELAWRELLQERAAFIRSNPWFSKGLRDLLNLPPVAHR